MVSDLVVCVISVQLRAPCPPQSYDFLSLLCSVVDRGSLHFDRGLWGELTCETDLCSSLSYYIALNIVSPYAFSKLEVINFGEVNEMRVKYFHSSVKR